MGDEAKKVFANNVKRCMEAVSPPLSQSALAALSGLHQRTLGRIINTEVVPRLVQMEKIAKGLKLDLWQLLVPGMEPENPPVLAPVTVKERELWTRLRSNLKELDKFSK